MEVFFVGDDETEGHGGSEFVGQARAGGAEIVGGGGEDHDAIDEADGEDLVSDGEVGGEGAEGLGVDADDVEVHFAGAFLELAGEGEPEVVGGAEAELDGLLAEGHAAGALLCEDLLDVMEGEWDGFLEQVAEQA